MELLRSHLFFSLSMVIQYANAWDQFCSVLVVEPVKENLNKAAFCCDSYSVFELEINMQMVENEQLSGNHQRLQAKRDK